MCKLIAEAAQLSLCIGINETCGVLVKVVNGTCSRGIPAVYYDRSCVVSLLQ